MEGELARGKTPDGRRGKRGKFSGKENTACKKGKKPEGGLRVGDDKDGGNHEKIALEEGVDLDASCSVRASTYPIKENPTNRKKEQKSPKGARKGRRSKKAAGRGVRGKEGGAVGRTP